MMIFGLNKEELVIGGLFGAFLGIWIGPYACFTIPTCAFLWAWTGAGHGAIWRKIGCPIIACFSTMIATHGNLYVWLGFPFMCLVLSLGYGIPDKTDSGSPLGRFWYWRVFSENEKRAHVATRATIYLLLLLTFIPAFLAR